MGRNELRAISDLRARFSKAVSRMYREGVPSYRDRPESVALINAANLDADPALVQALWPTDQVGRHADERLGAIRLGTAEELGTTERGLAATRGAAPAEALAGYVVRERASMHACMARLESVSPTGRTG